MAFSGNSRFAGSRCWVFGSSEPLPSGNAGWESRLAAFMERWQAHGAPVAGVYGTVQGRFLVIAETPDGATPAGCSIDTMKGEIIALEKLLGTRLQDGARLYFRGPEGTVETATRHEFKALVQAGGITPDTEVFDLTVTTLGDLRPGVFSKPLKESWHLKLYENAMAAKV